MRSLLTVLMVCAFASFGYAQSDILTNKKGFSVPIKIVSNQPSYLYFYRIGDESKQLLRVNKNYATFEDVQDTITLDEYVKEDYENAFDKTDWLTRLGAVEQPEEPKKEKKKK